MEEINMKTTGISDAGQDIRNFEPSNTAPEQVTEHYAEHVARALEATGKVTVREVQSNLVNQIHILFRVKEEDARDVAQNIVNMILQRTDQEERIEAFIGKQYLRKAGQLRFAWVLSLGCEDIKYASQIVCDAIAESTPQDQKSEVWESPLMGPGTPAGGMGTKGASAVRG